MTSRVAIIGAGPSGMAQLRAFESAHNKGAQMPELICYEKQEDWGGQWNYTWRTGTDAFGEPVHSSMYRNLWSNGPKEGLEFADYTFDEHFGRPISSYPPRPVLWDYINGRLEKSDVKQFVKFAHVVRWVNYDEQDQTFCVSVENLRTGETKEETFDYVIVGSGHFSFPNVPFFNGIESFPGFICHAHEFRGAEMLANKDVLLIGASYSAEDIGTQAFKMGARSVTFSYRSKPMGYDWPEGIEEQPTIDHFDGATVHFTNGQTREFDAVILCTGYLHHYPFLPSDLSINSPNNVYPDHLYKGVVREGTDRLFYLGAQDQWFTFNMFDAQAWYVRDVILGRIDLPSADDRRGDIDLWLQRLDGLSTKQQEVSFQADYIRDLIKRTDYPMFDVDAVTEIFNQWIDTKSKTIVNYRDFCYTSVMTRTRSVSHHTPWMLELDDSLDRYLSNPLEEPNHGIGSH
ncbi:NAD(P)-binding domain-containing protein [Corynebacterium sputi]|uniref:NAD(P)-binding domain-containing protein n=1 Tax=Corynebacterium sputi TaxID=489915 RepID=UPI00040260F5|nr:NAD(P)/FAD-dependent oxidoreductase [Corynebacterium sputi]